MTMTNEQIAQVVHEANQAYCKATKQAPGFITGGWDEQSEQNKKNLRSAVDATRADVFSGETVGPATQHGRWLEVKEADGWTLGPEKDEEKKEHPCMVPFDELPDVQKTKDRLFFAIVSELVLVGYDQHG